MNDSLESFLLIFGQNKYIAKPMKIYIYIFFHKTDFSL